MFPFGDLMCEDDPATPAPAVEGPMGAFQGFVCTMRAATLSILSAPFAAVIVILNLFGVTEFDLDILGVFGSIF